MRLRVIAKVLGVAVLSLALTPRAFADPQAQQPGAQTNTSVSSSFPEPHVKRDTKPSQISDRVQPQATETSERRLVGLAKDFVGDQRRVWTSPAKLRFADADWLAPTAGFTAGLFLTDHDVSAHLNRDVRTMNHYENFSNAGVAALAGGAGGLWLLSFPARNEHWRETGLIAGQAALNSVVAVEALKYSMRRQRPFEGDGRGSFFQGGTSFPSAHSAMAWSMAGVIAHEYPGPLTKLMAYGLASFVTYSRIRGRQHFPSDVFIGQMIGYMIAQDVYSRHYRPELGGSKWKSLRTLLHGDGNFSPANQGSPYVPLDSWIYPALDRLAAMGFIDSGFAGLRPWTRNECVRLLSEAEGKLPDAQDNAEVLKLTTALEHEFQAELRAVDGSDEAGFRLESLYSRTQHISGMPLSDGYHFAQTQINDFGRPYGEGWSTVNGFSAYATWGRWATYVRGEAQTAPATSALPLSARQTIQQVDLLPQVPPGTASPSINRFELLDAYVGYMLSNWQVSFGRQSLSWGPGDGGSMTLSSNVQPINMFRIARTTPLELPSILGWLGPVRTEFFLGQLSGSQFILNPSGFVGQFGHSLDPQPFIHGQKLSFRPTRNFEFGFFRTTIYGGPGFPFTTHTFLRSLLATWNRVAGSPDKPGKRTSGLDFSYRLPGLRNWLTFYADGLTYDQFSPIAYADRSVWRAGLFLSHVPRIPKLDLRVEGVYTNNPLGGEICCGFFYWNGTWRSGYTNEGNIIGN